MTRISKEEAEKARATLAALEQQEQNDESEFIRRLNEPVGKFEYTDLGNGERYAARNGEQCKWIVEKNKWIVWNGTKWVWDDDGDVVRRVKPFIEEIREEGTERMRMIEALSGFDFDKETQKEYAKTIAKSAGAAFHWAKLSQSRDRISATLKLARSEKGVSKNITELDSKGHYLGVTNGVLDLRKEKFRFIEGDPAYFMTKSCNAHYDPDAKCPNWEDFLNKIFEDDTEVIQFVQRVVGQGLIGKKGKDKLTIFYGSGQNGKSTLIDTIKILLGDYAKTTDGNMLTTSAIHSGGKTEYYLADLMSVRMVLINETKEGAQLAEQIVKMLVDSGELKARYPAGDPFDFQPVLTPIMTTNHKPTVGDDYAIWRRIILVPFEYRIPDEEKDPQFIGKHLEPELNGILNWALAGCLAFQEQGLNPPEKIVAATQQYKEEQDKIGEFIIEQLVTGAGAKEKMTTVMEAWRLWCNNKGYHPFGQRKLQEKLAARGINIVRQSDDNQNWIYGHKLISGNVIEASERFRSRSWD
jgi:putative DNA primase/helicase